MQNNINSFTFFRDYFNLIDTLTLKNKKEILVAIMDYMFKDEEPKLTGHNLAIFNTLKHQLNVSKNNSKRSKGYGAPKGNKNALKKQTKSELENNLKNKPKNKLETNKSRLSTFYFLISSFLFNKLLNKYSDKDIQKLKEYIIKWVEYKLERKEIYKERGLTALLTQIENNANEYGIDKVCDLINECMASNYKGIIFDKLKKENNYMSYQEKKQKEYEEVKRKFLEGD